MGFWVTSTKTLNSENGFNAPNIEDAMVKKKLAVEKEEIVEFQVELDHVNEKQIAISMIGKLCTQKKKNPST